MKLARIILRIRRASHQVLGRRLLPGCLALGFVGVVLFGVVVLRTIGNRIGYEVGNANVRPILVSSGIKVGLPKCDNDRKVFRRERSELLLANDPACGQRAAYGISVARCNAGWNDGFSSVGKHILSIGVEPPISLFECVFSQKNTTASPSFDSRRLARVAAVKVDENRFVRSKLDRRRIDHHIWSPVLLKLTTAFLQGLSGNHCKLIGGAGLLPDLGNESVSLLPAPAHLIELPVHRVPLEISNTSADNGGKSNDNRQTKLQPFSSWHDLLKGAYLVALFFIAMRIGISALSRYLERRQPYHLILSLAAFVAVCFHFAWILLFA